MCIRDRFATTSDGATLTGRLNPAANNSYGLGTSSLRWANFYSVVGNFSGTVTAAGAALSSGTHEKITLSGSTDPLIRFQEGTTNKAFISWHSGGYIRLQNQEDASILKIQDDIVFSMDDGSTYHKVWHAGNDGSGTGLDADTLDGLQASSFVRSDSSGQSISGNLTVGTGAASYLYMVDSDQGNRALHCNGDRIGFLKQDGNWSAYSKDNGGWVCELGLTVNGGNSSTIVMGDADEGSRQIHCNSNFIGFLKADGNWGSRCADDGSWQILGNTAFHGGNDGAGSGLDADLLDGVQGASYLRSDAADTASADITFGGGAGAISIAANSDIRFSNGTWSGEHAGKLQFHSNIFYIQGGSGGWQFRNPSAAGVISLSASGGIGGSALTVAQKVTFNGSDGAIAIGANSDIRFSNGNWTGDTAGKIQHHSNYLYVQGGSSGIIQRASDGTNIMLANNSNIYSYQTHTFQDGGGAITIAGNSDIRLVNGTWTGDYGAKIQHHDNRLFLQGGSSGVRLRNAAGSRQLKMDNSGNFGPDGSQDYNLGESGQRWNQVWAKTGIFTDDIGATIPSQFPGSNVQLMAYKSTNGQPITNTDCARVLIATDAKQTGAQGYHGSLDFGSSDCTAAVANNEFNWRVASVMSRGAGDTSSTIADGNLEFYTKTASGTVQKQMEIDPSGRVQKFYQPAFLVEHPNNASNSPKQRSDLYMSYLRGFSHVRFNVGSHFNNSTGLFTAPLPGIYCFNVTMTMDGGDGAGHDSDDSAGCYWRIQSNTGTGFYNRTGGNREWHSVNPQYFTESGSELTACFSTIEKLNTNATIGWYFSDWDDTDTRILTATLSGYLMG